MEIIGRVVVSVEQNEAFLLLRPDNGANSLHARYKRDILDGESLSAVTVPLGGGPVIAAYDINPWDNLKFVDEIRLAIDAGTANRAALELLHSAEEAATGQAFRDFEAFSIQDRPAFARRLRDLELWV